VDFEKQRVVMDMDALRSRRPVKKWEGINHPGTQPSTAGHTRAWSIEHPRSYPSFGQGNDRQRYNGLVLTDDCVLDEKWTCRDQYDTELLHQVNTYHMSVIETR
jgi:hypothetical protein